MRDIFNFFERLFFLYFYFSSAHKHKSPLSTQEANNKVHNSFLLVTVGTMYSQVITFLYLTALTIYM